MIFSMFFSQKKIFVFSSLFLFLFETCVIAQTSSKPNIVFIMIDDLGYGDIGCYGSMVNRTPNIDHLAKKGARFTDYHANGPMCSPTRAALMTGRYQYRYGRKFESALNGSLDGPDNGLPAEAYTLAEALKDAGYATGMYGKWHLGYKPPLLPFDQGFQDFIGLGYGDGDHFTHVDRVGNSDWWHNDTLKPETGYSVDLITNHSIDFIRKNKSHPFFLYVSHLAIHFPWQGPNDPPHRIQGKNYSKEKWGIIPDRKNVAPHIKAMVESVDESVGKIIGALRQEGLEKNTLVIFTSDNGGYINYSSGGFENISSNGPFRGQKGDIYEGGHRVPFIAYWPGKIKEGVTKTDLLMTMDMYPSFISLAEEKIHDSLKLDGMNILPVFFNNRKVEDRAVCWKTENNKAIRKGKWKVDIIENKAPELYDLESDPGETKDIAAKYPEIVNQLLKQYPAWEKDVTANYTQIN
ncbi:MAG: sulfatase-like hydrolase/transferase [Ferruginibacter sp.]